MQIWRKRYWRFLTVKKWIILYFKYNFRWKTPDTKAQNNTSRMEWKLGHRCCSRKSITGGSSQWYNTGCRCYNATTGSLTFIHHCIIINVHLQWTSLTYTRIWISLPRRLKFVKGEHLRGRSFFPWISFPFKFQIFHSN